jgi:hypothetical protein
VPLNEKVQNDVALLERDWCKGANRYPQIIIKVNVLVLMRRACLDALVRLTYNLAIDARSEIRIRHQRKRNVQANDGCNKEGA